MNFTEAARLAGDTLAPIGPEAPFEGRAMAAALAGEAPSALPMLAFRRLTPDMERELEAMLARRLSGEPLQYILGRWEFMGLPIICTPAALIPRQDTETLCELALRLPPCPALDMCCGTGCIGVSLAKLGGFGVTFGDISPECLALARRNAALNGVEGDFILTDLFDRVQGQYGLICCNPPYIPSGEIAGLQREVGHEPRLALDGGGDGLDCYRRIAAEYRARLAPGGTLLLEVGAGQMEAVLEIFGGGAAHEDLNGIARVAEIRPDRPQSM